MPDSNHPALRDRRFKFKTPKSSPVRETLRLKYQIFPCLPERQTLINPLRAEKRMVQTAGWSSQVARQAHNLKVVGSNPTPATNESRWIRRNSAAFAFLTMIPSTYRVYLIINDAGRRYIGISENVTKRLSDHNDGLSLWTAKYRPWTLYWTSNEMSLSEARKLENLLKRQKGGSGLQPLLDQHQGS